MLLYLYDLKIKGLNSYNTLKRRFYYNLGKSRLSSAPWRTKSALLVPDDLEVDADAFFEGYRGAIEVFKARTDDLKEFIPSPF